MPMYNIIYFKLHNSNCSVTTGSLYLYSTNEATNLNNNIENADNFKSFKYEAKLLGNTVAQPHPNQVNRFLKLAAIAVLLKYLSNF